jgi:HlyD family secretion protein
MKKLLMFVAVLWCGGAFGFWYMNDHRSQPVSFRTVSVRRGDLRSTINATGTLEPEEVVDVGAQVAGLIESFGTDPCDPGRPVTYGTHVEEGTVLARLSSALFKARVDQARGRVTRAKADIDLARAKLHHAQRELERTKKLRDRGTGTVVSEQEYETAFSTHESAKATLGVNESELLVAQADLEEATVNLGYTTIRSPVKGVILDRRINIGQTVVASLNAPSLFLIAKDLSRLEIWSSVNEADIGSIHESQKVRFTVAALPRETFEGTVAKIRLNANMAQNVVTYTVVIAVDNSRGRLLPYLTVRLQFEVQAREHVLLVPNAALRWHPSVQYVVPDAREHDAVAVRRNAPARADAKSPDSHGGDDLAARVWIKRGDLVRPVDVTTGLSDGVMTEICGNDLKEGAEIVLGADLTNSDPDALSILPHTWSEAKK